MQKPIIGITTRLIKDEEYAITVEGNCSAYAESIHRAGGVPILIPLVEGPLLEDYCTLCDGVVFTGGEDIDPSRYGATPSVKLGAVSPIRDTYEITLFNLFHTAHKPILGICRGMQLINVACSGTLIQDIPSERPSDIAHTAQEDRWYELVHTVSVTPDSLLRSIVKDIVLPVNSIHHQCVDSVGVGLRVSARSDDGIVEAMESSIANNILAVQWHPEVLWQTSATVQAHMHTHALFSWLIMSAGNRASQ